jgi:hypothetical protein
MPINESTGKTKRTKFTEEELWEFRMQQLRRVKGKQPDFRQQGAEASGSGASPSEMLSALELDSRSSHSPVDLPGPLGSARRPPSPVRASSPNFYIEIPALQITSHTTPAAPTAPAMPTAPTPAAPAAPTPATPAASPAPAASTAPTSPAAPATPTAPATPAAPAIPAAPTTPANFTAPTAPTSTNLTAPPDSMAQSAPVTPSTPAVTAASSPGTPQASGSRLTAGDSSFSGSSPSGALSALAPAIRRHVAPARLEALAPPIPSPGSPPPREQIGAIRGGWFGSPAERIRALERQVEELEQWRRENEAWKRRIEEVLRGVNTDL